MSLHPRRFVWMSAGDFENMEKYFKRGVRFAVEIRPRPAAADDKMLEIKNPEE